MTHGLIERIRHAETVAAQRISRAEAAAEEKLRALGESHLNTLREMDDSFLLRREHLPDLARERVQALLDRQTQRHDRQVRLLEKHGADHENEVIRLMIQTLLE
ncbi:hypothetical protein JCM14469_36860 [Desulfatiferula olefinivorans]